MTEPLKALPFSDADFVGPEDRPRPEWNLTMYGWQVYGNPTVKDWLDQSAGGVARAVNCAPKVDGGLIYAVASDPEAPKAHRLSISDDHRTVSWSLYTPLLAFNFPKVNEKHKAVFKCRPETYGDVKVLVIEVASYRVEKVDKETQDQVAATTQQPE
ncbi:MAG TPA: hypothetical protein VD969_16995 [Symbiobacteriaceae bacterium]|nr:hypothetical protein [Symbiobacteriaceae bacterium]